MQCNRAPLGHGGMGESCHGCAANKSPATSDGRLTRVRASTSKGYLIKCQVSVLLKVFLEREPAMKLYEKNLYELIWKYWNLTIKTHKTSFPELNLWDKIKYKMFSSDEKKKSFQTPLPAFTKLKQTKLNKRFFKRTPSTFSTIY